VRCGNVVVAMAPLRDRPPTHGYLAFYAWIADGVRAQAIVNLSDETVPGAAVCAVPRLA
jgi:cobalamin biosynthesis Mg chelatase CobN